MDWPTGSKVRKKDAHVAWMDLCYDYANRIYEYLVGERYVQDENGQQSLNAFMEIITFVYCCMDMQIQRRLSGRRLKDLKGVLCTMRSAWGRFFVEYPKGPRLESTSAEAVSASISKRCAIHHASYASDLKNHGALQAMRHSCYVFLKDLEKYARPRPTTKTLVEPLSDPDGPGVRYIETLVFSLNHDVNMLLAHQAG